ncbi:CPBP family intramembrane glutamic endopeptidase [Actinokineospora sp. HUAS TT18]|uniref:CPBP family intramembrane glutamic endopeptidase n=1 Tax=Actinokineospora sp. HUAS TT18 TaxID=3447451 RepID=UPI003F51D46C
MRSGQLHPVWRLAGFAAAVAVAFGITGVVVGLVGTPWLFPVVLAASLLAVTWLALRLDGRGLADLGLRFTRGRLSQAGAGFLIGTAVFSGVALTHAAMVGATWRFGGTEVVGAVVAGLTMMLVSVVVEELVFRGYAFRQLSALGGPGVAVVVTSVAFGAYHLIGRPYWAMGAVFVVVMSLLGGLVFAYALLRSGGLPLVIGLHWGGNWAMSSLFGSGAGAVWSADFSHAQLAALTAPDLGPHLPYLAALAVIALVISSGRFTRSPG